jgi:CRISPR-associated endonuclease/helicase Cas3
MDFHAHTSPNSRDPRDWEPLFTPFGTGSDDCRREACEKCARMDRFHGHINKVAFWAARFAGEMFPSGSSEAKAAREWGYLAGLWHDLGKFAPEWQAYLRRKSDPHADEVSGKVDHSTAGARHADRSIQLFGRILAYALAGHHAGLSDGIDDSASSLENRLKKQVDPFDSAPREILEFCRDLPPPVFALGGGFALAFFQRMLFSALVDADFLATEAFMSPPQTTIRPGILPEMADIEKALLESLSCFQPQSSPVNKIRAEVLGHCLDSAERVPGFFSLTVPTGGGKTLSSLAFALRHARLHDLRRVVYVIPFTSIIEQNAAVFRKALAELGDDIVLEHHSNLDPDASHATSRSRLVAENWDARVIVTTNVQFFESLHSNRTSRCRKLHRIARSVIIFDEAQTLPVDYLAPCLRSMEELVKHYGSTVVLCTATQPAIERNLEFPNGIPAPTEIIPDPADLHRRLRRVKAVCLGKMPDAGLLPKLCEHEQMLCIVNTRRHARELFELLPGDGCRFHLSALMCPAHRSLKLKEIKSRLKNGDPVRLVSTQLVEAGVDIDFPVVFRALSGLDSIAQAAGRCDREGRLTSLLGRPGGQLFIFEPPSLPPAGFLRATADSASEVLAGPPRDLLSPEAIESYFRHHYWRHQEIMDRHRILDCWPAAMTRADDLLLFRFKTCAENFRLIANYTEPVLIPYGDTGAALCAELRATFDPARLRFLARQLQRLTVQIPKQQHQRLLSSGILLAVHENFHILNSTCHYSEDFGLHPEPDLAMHPEQSIL